MDLDVHAYSTGFRLFVDPTGRRLVYRSFERVNVLDTQTGIETTCVLAGDQSAAELLDNIAFSSDGARAWFVAVGGST